jgi:hypothetical protein
MSLRLIASAEERRARRESSGFRWRILGAMAVASIVSVLAVTAVMSLQILILFSYSYGLHFDSFGELLGILISFPVFMLFVFAPRALILMALAVLPLLPVFILSAFFLAPRRCVVLAVAICVGFGLGMPLAMLGLEGKPVPGIFVLPAVVAGAIFGEALWRICIAPADSTQRTPPVAPGPYRTIAVVGGSLVVLMAGLVVIALAADHLMSSSAPRSLTSTPLPP